MSSGNQARAALQKHFPRPFTDRQWAMLAAQGYEQDIATGARTVEQVVAEIQALMAAVRADPAGAQPSETESLPADPRTWEDMEKWVLARSLAGGGSSRVRPAPGTAARPAPGTAITGMGTYTKASEPPSRRWWVWAALGGVAVVVAVAVLIILLVGGESTASTVSVPAVTTTAPPVTTSSTTSSSTTTSTGLTATTAVDVTPTFVAQLTGAEAIPAVTTDATGTLTLTVAEDGASVDYVFEVSNLSDVTVARLRVGAAGATGDEILAIFQGPTIVGLYSGVVAEGSLTAAQFLDPGPLAGKTIADLVALIEAGTVYLNVGTVTNHNGELRGQLE